MKISEKKLYSYILISLLYSILFKHVKSEYNTGNNFSIVTPLKLIKEIEKINQSKNGEIPYRTLKFGDIPFGKSVLAMIFLEPQADGSNYWCNYDLTKIPSEIKKYSAIYKEYFPMILVDQGQCSYSKKALNVQLRQGSIMLIIDDDNNLDNNDKYNILDLKGNSVKIPAIIIPRNYGDIIINYIREQKSKKIGKENKTQPIIVNIKFSAYNPDGTIEMNLFMSSDDINAIYFFREFQKYKELLGKKLKFSPIYKYHSYKSFDSNNDVNNKENYYPCFSKRDMNYCSNKNTDLKIYNPRYVLLENLRQSCIFIIYGLDIYWKYMIEFGEKCINLNNPIFNEECSLESLYNINLDNKSYNKIQNCMQDLIDFNSKVDEDYKLYNYRKVYEYPLITLNGMKFKGIWLPRIIFNSICSSFIHDEKICGSPQVKNLTKKDKVYSPSLVFIIVIFIFFFTIYLVVCYIKIVYRAIEQTIIDKIHNETIKSIGKYSLKKYGNYILT